MSKKGSRQLKISSLHRCSNHKSVPQLRISGLWMEQLGFKIGDQVRITTRNELLVIEPLPLNETEQDYKTALKAVKQTLKQLG